MRVMLGLGCDRDTSLITLQQAVKQALSSVDLSLNDVAGTASIDKKNDEAALLQLAQQQGWPLHFFPAEALAQVPVPNPSETVQKYMGTPAVAEAAALLASGGELILEKYKYHGADGKNATVSIARMNDGK